MPLPERKIAKLEITALAANSNRSFNQSLHFCDDSVRLFSPPSAA